MRRLALILLLPLAACSSGSEGGEGTASTPAPMPSSPGSLGQPRDLTTGLAVPWAVAFLPSGDALVTERNSARVLRVTPQGQATPIGTVPGVEAEGEGGLMGVAVSPTFNQDRLVYLHFTASDDNRVVRFRYDGRMGPIQPIVTGIPKGGNHNGGRIAFGPDKFLYIATGEVNETQLAQDKDSLGGKILRVTAEGKPAPGNPFNSRVWTYGHRNVQGLAWDDKGRMYATEFGQNTYDEINRIEKGKNYGWPEVEGVGGKPEYTDPLLTWSTDESSPSGLAYAKGSLWAAALRGARLWQVPLTADGKAARPVPHFEDRYGRIRAAVQAPDGALWITTSNKDGRGDPQQGDDRILTIPLP
ncbi:PQQ-dependent sugar dehydrogenase [Actinomadura rudentiformis]|uniref:PQQ-dependent sugar dehydrogenase n=1 Tax=Actinomadura rudentiformis TaxID=359158 RepID=A0A6H9YQJ3_9ACTN|nr:PQQ-dependent sugar dehydrogenase [Actinomadura rudentiformis]KAB2342407.1 PQQ-dependent sugar dehydrogenase [Actinomadura rudentiformis]